jgi:hypothetical protein
VAIFQFYEHTKFCFIHGHGNLMCSLGHGDLMCATRRLIEHDIQTLKPSLPKLSRVSTTIPCISSFTLPFTASPMVVAKFDYLHVLVRAL